MEVCLLVEGHFEDQMEQEVVDLEVCLLVVELSYLKRESILS